MSEITGTLTVQEPEKSPLELALEQIAQLTEDLAYAKDQLVKSQNTAMNLSAQLSAQEIGDRNAFRRALRLELTAIKGEVPILWIQSNDPSIMEMKFNRPVMDMIHKVCPGIQTVLFSEPGVVLQELTSAELEKLGLARIVTQHTITTGVLPTSEKPTALPAPAPVDDAIEVAYRVEGSGG